MGMTGKNGETSGWCYDCYHGSHQRCKGYIGVKSKGVSCECPECFIIIRVK